MSRVVIGWAWPISVASWYQMSPSWSRRSRVSSSDSPVTRVRQTAERIEYHLRQNECRSMCGRAHNGHSSATVPSPTVLAPVSYTHLRAHETDSYLVCRLL